jgi:voltage-gated potassium channel
MDETEPLPDVEWVLPAVSLVFLVAYSLLVLATSAPDLVRTLLVATIASCWVALIVSFVWRLLRASTGSRLRFVREHRQDLAAAVFPLLGVFSPLRRLHLLPGFRGASGNALRSRLGVRAALYAVTFIYVLALTELAVERDHPEATIRTFGNAIWWACVTVATVGYGDFTPVTPLGRIVAIALMIGGVAILGTTSALIVSYVSERVRGAK